MDREIIETLRRDQNAGVALLLAHYGGMLHYIVRGVLRDAGDVEECVSDICLRVCDKIERYSSARGSFSISTLQCEGGVELISSGLLFEKNGMEWLAAFPQLQYGVYTTEDLFWGEVETRGICGMLSYPFGASAQRGYVLYHERYAEDRLATMEVFQYIHVAQMFHGSRRYHTSNFYPALGKAYYGE